MKQFSTPSSWKLDDDDDDQIQVNMSPNQSVHVNLRSKVLVHIHISSREYNIMNLTHWISLFSLLFLVSLSSLFLSLFSLSLFLSLESYMYTMHVLQLRFNFPHLCIPFLFTSNFWYYLAFNDLLIDNILFSQWSAHTQTSTELRTNERTSSILWFQKLCRCYQFSCRHYQLRGYSAYLIPFSRETYFIRMRKQFHYRTHLVSCKILPQNSTNNFLSFGILNYTSTKLYCLYIVKPVH